MSNHRNCIGPIFDLDAAAIFYLKQTQSQLTSGASESFFCVEIYP